MTTNELREEMDGKCIVIGAGELKAGTVEKGEGDLVIAVDGGIGYCSVLNLEPDLLLGDFDSVSDAEAKAVEELEHRIPDRVIRLPKEKDDTDMLAALREGLHRGYRDFHIYGGTGGRFDHTFANIQCLLFLKKQGAAGCLIGGNGVIMVLMNETVHFREGMEGYLSLFTLTEESSGVTIEGMKYPLKDAVLRNDFPVGISNEFTGQEAAVTVEKGQLVCMLNTPQQAAGYTIWM